MINNPRDTIMSTYNPDLVQAALRNAITQFQQQTLALSTSAGATLSDPTSATGINTGPGYYRHSRASSLAAPNNNKNAKRRKVYIAFDLYGTLLSTDSIVPELAKHYGHEAAPGIATLWRRFQLEYTWRITSMGEFKNFHEITRSALGHALMEHSGIKLTATAAAQLMKAYDALHTFPDVEAGLSMLQKAKAGEAVDTASGIRKKLSPPPENQDETDGDEIAHTTLQEPPEIETFIFTNGTPDMVLRSVVTSPELSPHTKASENGLFSDPDCIVTVDHVQCYKPDPRTYKHLMDVAGIRTEQDRRNMWVVSANPFDVVGAKAAGLRAAWIDRSGRGWVDRLDEMRVPSVTATGVDEAVKAILSWN